MNLRVRLFGELRERAGWGERELIGTPVHTPGDLWVTLAPHLGESPLLPQRIRVAVNQHFSTAEQSLADGDEVAFLPPISGG